jgi:uncharacterized protein YtpQ (UPF0354 family)
MKKHLITLCAVVAVAVQASFAQETRVYPTLPGTSFRDYSRPGAKLETQGNSIVLYPTLPGTSFRDHSRPGARLETRGNSISVYPTLPGTSFRDYSRPGLVIE